MDLQEAVNLGDVECWIVADVSKVGVPTSLTPRIEDLYLAKLATFVVATVQCLHTLMKLVHLDRNRFFCFALLLDPLVRELNRLSDT